jgi:hypothetical protein
MDAGQPRVRPRGFFLHSATEESVEAENPEGVVVRVRSARQSTSRHVVNAGHSGRSHTAPRTEEAQPEIRSGSVTGSRQRVDSPR